ncbi:hypothetical protein PV350_00765 [Streptomyces sp. PA03-6a]|nr:hypothetical protein [Streptomyces sp. PA03-6a]
MDLGVVGQAAGLFAVTNIDDMGGMSVYAVVFLVLVAVWCFAGRHFATRPVIAKALSRWGHILLPLVLVEGGAFGV